MYLQTLADNLYRELLYASLCILLILIFNNIVIYRQKITSLFSMMLLCGAVMCVFDILWDLLEDHVELAPYIYTCAGFYTVALLLFVSIFHCYFLERFGVLIHKKWLLCIAYGLPNALTLILCVTDPWTHFFFRVDDDGIVRFGLMFSTLFAWAVWAYTLSAIGLAVSCLFILKKREEAHVKAAKSLIVFGFLFVITYVMQGIILGKQGSDYQVLSLAVSISLIYLTTDVNIRSLLETQAQIEAVEADLRVAAKIQSDALPPAHPALADYPQLSLCASMTMAKEVGGDFYDYFAIDADRICFLIGDVAGKGMPAALFMMKTKTMIQDYAQIYGSTGEIFTAVNSRLCEANGEGMFVTAWIGILDTRTMTLQYTNAGHNCPIFKQAYERSAVLYKRHGLFLAGMEDTEYCLSEQALSPGDRLLLYTDGVTEAHSASKEYYGEERLIELLDGASGKDDETVLGEILRDVNDFAAGEPQFDDITMVMLSFH